MSKWLERLREHEKKRHMAGNDTDKTPIIDENSISGVLSVRSGRESANFYQSGLAGEENASRYEGRASILEYDCGLPREDAECLARIQISATWH